MFEIRSSQLRSIFVLSFTALSLALSGCKETEPKVKSAPVAKKTAENSSPTIPQSEFPATAKSRMALKEVSEDTWTLQSFSSVMQTPEGKDQLYIASAFSAPRDGKILSECNATGKFATVILKSPSAIRLSSQVPTQIRLGAKKIFNSIYTIRYGAMADLEAAGCTPSFQWHQSTNPEGVIELLSGLMEESLAETVSPTSGAKLQAAFTQSEDQLVLHYKTEGKDTIVTTKFVYTRDAKPVIPEVKVDTPKSDETPEDKTSPDQPAESQSRYGIHD